MIAKRLIIEGRVQGVGFRAWTVRAADAMGISGWVRNRRDGSVEILAQASKELLDKFIELTSEGPKSARVDAVHSEEVSHDEVQGFSQHPTI